MEGFKYAAVKADNSPEGNIPLKGVSSFKHMIKKQCELALELHRVHQAKTILLLIDDFNEGVGSKQCFPEVPHCHDRSPGRHMVRAVFKEVMCLPASDQGACFGQ